MVARTDVPGKNDPIVVKPLPWLPVHRDLFEWSFSRHPESEADCVWWIARGALKPGGDAARFAFIDY